VPPAPDAEELDRRLEQTVAWWHRWGSKLRLAGPHEPAAKRSAIVLKALVHAPTGAFVAAPTTSLPERIGGDCNWDYRFSWIRDSVFSARALVQLGCHEEADGFRRFVERSAAGNAESLRIAYGVGGERRLAELELTHLEGYRRSAPVRAGNAASVQEQFDVYGELLELAWRWHGLGHSPDDDYWRFLLSLVEAAAERWKDPDRGIWETREKPRHFVHSKVMCWVALDRGIRLSEECLRRAPVRRWRAVRDELRDAIETRGWSKRKQSFVQAFDTTEVDAALLLLPSVDFVAYDDERMIKTTDAVRDELCVDGLVRRYQDDDDAFLPCSFWLAECLARQGRVDEARATFDRAVAAANDLGLFSEQYAARSRELLGNFPQGLSHLSHILAAVALTEATPPGLETDIAG
jgi:GH15 family glucan-1,4-alpha-glucosidase